MDRKKNFFVSMAGDTPVAPDLFYGTLSILIYAVANALSGITNWLGWFVLAIVVNCSLLIIEIMRFRILLLPKYKPVRRGSLIFISGFLGICILSLVKGIFRL